MRLWMLPCALVLFWCSNHAALAQTAGAARVHYCMGCNFAGAAATNFDFSGAILVGPNFAGAQLAAASFRGAKIVGANFQGADLSNAGFDGAECTACNFQGVKLDGATFLGVRMVAANFIGFASKVTDAALRDLLGGCNVCNFKTASLAGRDLSGATLVGVDLTEADLRNSRFDGAVLCWYVIDGAARGTKCDNLKNARVDGASFAGVRLCNDPSDAHSCTPVTADALRRNSGSALQGAALP